MSQVYDENMVFVFVYGTLMSSFENNYLLKDSVLISKAFTSEKFSMRAKFIPFLTRVDDFKTEIYGEVYAVDNKVLRILDALEGHPNFYKREEISITIPSGETIKAWCYLINDKKIDNSSYSIVKSGNYFNYRYDLIIENKNAFKNLNVKLSRLQIENESLKKELNEKR